MRTMCILAAVGVAASVAQGQVLFDNGTTNMNTGTVAANGQPAPGGRFWSECDYNNTGPFVVNNDVAGYASSVGLGFRLADDFTVPAGQTWNITQIGVYSYQTGNNGVTTTYNHIDLRILNGPPSLGSTVVFSDTTTNRYPLGVHEPERIFYTNRGIGPGLTATCGRSGERERDAHRRPTGSTGGSAARWAPARGARW